MRVTPPPQSHGAGVTRNRRRWWVLRLLTRNPLLRSVDRVEGWAIVLVVGALCAAVFLAFHVSDSVTVSESAAIKREIATRHSVQAAVIAPGERRQQGAATTIWAHLQWFNGSETQDATIRVPHSVKPGDHVQIWLDNHGDVKSPPRSLDDAAASGTGAAILLWSVLAGLGIWLLTMLRKVLDSRRYRAWDQALVELAGHGGGSTTHNS
jgi:hypothetical protein